MGTSAPDAGQAVELDIVLPHDRRWHKTDLAVSPAGAVTNDRMVLAGDAREFFGWSIRETTGAAGAQLRLRDGDVNGEVIANANLAANESIRDLFAPHGVQVDTGKVFLDMLGGSVEGVVYWR